MQPPIEIRFRNGASSDPEDALSNLASNAFVFRGVPCASMEGVLQSLKFGDPEKHRQVCTLTGHFARKEGLGVRWFDTQTLWWDGEPYKRDSEEYQQLLDEAYEQMFRQNDRAREILLSTGERELKHSIGGRTIEKTVLTQHEFCSRLMKIRAQLRAEQFMEF